MRDDQTQPPPVGAWLATGYEVVAELIHPMPTGVTVSDDGRVFVSFPRWGDDVLFTVAEIVDGRAVAFPDQDINTWPAASAADHLVSVQSVIVDPAGHLWLLDAASPEMKPHAPDGPKLVEVDLATNAVVRTVHIDPTAMTETTYLNDVRFDLSRGSGGYAYITDSQPSGGLIVADLGLGQTWARLRGHETTRAVADFRAVTQGVVHTNYQVGSDGIALGAGGERLYYSPLSSRRLYSVSTEALLDRTLDDDAVARTIVDHGDKPASDGLETDTDGRIYATAYEHSAVLRVDPDGSWHTVLHAPDLLWPDTLSLAADGHLYVSVNQLPRSPLFNHGVDDRVPPYRIIRVPVPGRPVRLTRP